MNDGINTYEIKYFGDNDQVLKTSQFIIVKETPKSVETPAAQSVETSSGSQSSE